jgi:hypothetical protein
MAELNTALEKGRAGKGVLIKSLAEVELPKAEEVFELAISGLG